MSKLKITWIGHASFLIQIGDETLITDTNFSDKLLLVKRQKPLSILPHEIPPLQAALLSHAHYDHFDVNSYKYFSTHLPLIIPFGLKNLVSRYLPNPTHEIQRWQSLELKGWKIHALPVKHFSFRLLPFRHTAACAYLIEKDGYSIYFAGDTAYGHHFVKTSNLFKIDVALLPVGACRPRAIAKYQHMDSYDAIAAQNDLKASIFIPYHWGSFKLGAEGIDQPKQWLEEEKLHLKQQIEILEPGQSFEWEKEKC